MRAYKGFDVDLKCRGFQFEVGKTYDAEAAKLGEYGFHACTDPLDVLAYYAPGYSRFCVVELEGVTDDTSSDSKRVGRRITIVRELSYDELLSAAYTTPTKAKAPHRGIAGGNNVVNVSGKRGLANAIGYRSVANASAASSAADASGECSVANASGCWSIASAHGHSSIAIATGGASVATTTGDVSMASVTGYRSAAITSGDRSAAVALSEYGSAEADGIGGVSVAAGLNCRVRGCIGSAIVCVERGKWNGDTYPLIAIKAAMVDGSVIKTDTWYCLENGEFVECEGEGDE